MNLILVTALATQFAFLTAYPADGLIEVEKQRLVKFPEETFRTEDSEQKSSEAKRILEEINKINKALGYVRKRDQNLPSILDSNQFLFPKPAYHPFHSQSFEPSIRNLNPYPQYNQDPNPKSIKSSSSRLFFYNFQPDKQESVFEIPVKEFVLHKYANTKQKQSKYIRESKHIGYKVIEEPYYYDKQQKKVEPKLSLYFVPRQLNINKKSIDDNENEKLKQIETLPTIRPYLKAITEKHRPNTKSSISIGQKIVTSPSTTTTFPPPRDSLKTPFASFFKRPGHVVTAQKVEAKPILLSVPLATPQYAQQNVRPDAGTSDGWEVDSSEEIDYPQDYEKHIFSAKRKEMAEVQKEALKESGIIIQRLKVRKGGIAIAGPGGVATAGSGGTAIVGPGGYALTHPRSLTIAGPGAKVIAIPESTDLQDALLQTSSGRKYTDQGEVVATGPVIYYSPDDKSQIL